jgi:hypothetical protein
MRLARLADDTWELDSGEVRHRQAPDRFWLPPAAERNALQAGQLVKLVFLIEAIREDGSKGVQGERMWVLVRERRGPFYVGTLANTPMFFTADDDEYMVPGAEIAFLPEHVIQIRTLPAEVIAARLAEAPTRRWPMHGND